MATNQSNVMTSHNLLNYSGMLFNKGDVRTPFCTMIAGRAKQTNSAEFVVGVEFDTGGVPAQPAITETASLTAPTKEFTTRSQVKNVTQIFQRAIGISYAKQSDMAALSGLNLAGQVANPATEKDFQVARVMERIGNDIEYTAINGVYQVGGYDDVPNKTRGMLSAITSNIIAGGGKGLGLWLVADAMKAISDSNGDISDLALWVDATTLFQLNADAKDNDLTIVPNSRNVNGIQLSSLITPLGEIFIHLANRLPAGTALIANMNAIAPVYQPVPGKGNFFEEALAKTGAEDASQIYGQWGLDHGPEWYHAKITGLSTAFNAPVSAKKIYVTSPVPVVDVDATLTGAVLDKTTVAADNTAKVAVASLEYDVKPGTDPSLTYLWQIRAKTGTVWTDLTSAYTGYNTYELTVQAADAEKHYRCKVTASGSATGTVYSNECTMATGA